MSAMDENQYCNGTHQTKAWPTNGQDQPALLIKTLDILSSIDYERIKKLPLLEIQSEKNNEPPLLIFPFELT